MKERIKGAFTKKKIFHFLKMALFVVALSLILLAVSLMAASCPVSAAKGANCAALS